jgi:hypothetical protein
MRRPCRKVLIVLLTLLGCHSVFAQAEPAAAGSFIVSGRVKVGSKNIALKKERFYLFRGGREANRSLIDRLKTANVTSRDCFYCRLNASKEFMDWLKAGDCESVHCREITTEDIAKVPEFQAAHRKGLQPFKKKPDLARKWLVTNLEPGFRSGFYDARKIFIKEFQKEIVQTAMTDNGAAALAYFPNIPMGSAVEKFIYTNLFPIEIGEKSYVWVCEVDVGKDKKTPILDAPETTKVVKKCEVIVRDLPICVGGTCDQK